MGSESRRFEFQVLDIVGEQVSLVPTKLAPSETAIVEFDKFYVPDTLKPEEKELLKKTMAYLFSNAAKPLGDPETGKETKETTRNPLPPCGEKEKTLVLESLLYRKRLLQQQLFDLGIAMNPQQLRSRLASLESEGKLEAMLQGKQGLTIQGKETLLSEYHLNHWRKLDKYIRSYEAKQECISLGDFLYKDIQLDLSDDQIRALLQQYVFFLLQSGHPLDEFKSVDPKAPAFVARLQQNPLGDKFPSFLTAYKSKKFPIPPTIAKVLEATDMDPKSMANEVARLLQAEREELLKKIYGILPPSDPIWKRIGETKDIVRIVDVLQVKSQECEEELRRLLAQLEAATREANQATQGKALLQTEKDRLTRRVVELEILLRASRQSEQAKEQQLAQLREQVEAAQADFDRRIEGYAQQLRDCEEQKTAIQGRLDAQTAENERLNAEITRLREEVRNLQAVQEAANRNLEELRRTHAAELAAERQRVEGAEAGRRAAEQATEQANASLAERTAEVASTRASLEAANAQVRAKEATVAELTNALREQEAAVANTREQLATKTAEATQLAADLAAAREQLQGLTDRMAEVQESLQEATEAANGFRTTLDALTPELEALEEELAAANARIQDLETQLRRCEEEKRSLQASATGAASSTAELSGRLRVAEEERDTVRGRVAELEAQLKQCRENLATEEARAKAAEDDAARQRQAREEQERRAKAAEDAVEVKQGEVDAAEQRADAAEERASELEGRVSRTIEEADQRVSAAQADLRQQFDDALDATKEEFAASLKEQKERIEAASADQLKTTRDTYEATLAEQKQSCDEQLKSKEEAVDRLRETYERSLAVVQRIASFLESGAEEGLKGAAAVEPDMVQANALDAIVAKLEEATSNTGSVASGTSSPRSASSGSSSETTLNLCYIVFLTSFLWQANYNLLLPGATHTPEQEDQYQKQKLLQFVCTTVFQGGSKHTKETWATSVAPPQFGFRKGLFEEIERISKSPSERGKVGGKLQTNIGIIRRFLHLFHKVARAMEGNTTNLTLDSMDTHFLDILVPALTTVLTENKELYRPPTFHLEEQFASMANVNLKENQPHIPSIIFTKRLVKKSSGYTIETKAIPAEGGGSQLTYGVIFYLFLEVLRDYLNHITGTVRNQCPLPPFLLNPGR